MAILIRSVPGQVKQFLRKRDILDDRDVCHFQSLGGEIDTRWRLTGPGHTENDQIVPGTAVIEGSIVCPDPVHLATEMLDRDCRIGRRRVSHVVDEQFYCRFIEAAEKIGLPVILQSRRKTFV